MQIIIKVIRGVLKPLQEFIEWVRATFPLTVSAMNLLGKINMIIFKKEVDKLLLIMLRYVTY